MAERDTLGLLDDIDSTLPALTRCLRISARAAGAGFEWDSVEDVWDQVASERAEFAAEEDPASDGMVQDGKLL